MADTKADVVLPPNTWVNLYAATGIAVGTALDIWNKGSMAVVIAIKAIQPGSNIGVPLYTAGYKYITAGESGAWAYSTAPAMLSVQLGA